MNARPQRRVSPLAGKSADQHFSAAPTTTPRPTTKQQSAQAGPEPVKKPSTRVKRATEQSASSIVEAESAPRVATTVYLDADVDQRLRGAVFDLPRELRADGISGVSDAVNYLLGLALTQHEKTWNNGERYPPAPGPFRRGRAAGRTR